MEFVPAGRVRPGATSWCTTPRADDPTQAFALSRLDRPQMTHVPMGIFRSVSRPTYDDLVRAQVDAAIDTAGGRPPTPTSTR